MMKCRFPKCERTARKGWTTCDRHYTAGDSVKNDERKKLSPKRLLEAETTRLGLRPGAKARDYTMPYGAGDYVNDKTDPRHVGRVVYAHGVSARVRWENGFLSDILARHLEPAETP